MNPLLENIPIETYKEFKGQNFYLNNKKKYYLLPFKLKRLKNNKEIITNDIGEYLIFPSGTTEKIINNNISSEETPNLYQDLLSKFFISESTIPELIDVYSSRYSTKKSFLDQFTGLHIFVITLRCDQSCHYCQVSRVNEGQTSEYDMKKETIGRGIDLMLKSPAKNVTMEFQGGEPLLVFENIQYAVLLAKEKNKNYNKNITFVICTNLQLIDEEKLLFLKEHDILISTSIDGPQQIHDKNRPRADKDSSYDLTIQGLDLSRKILGKDRISALMTTSTLSLKYPKEIVDTYVEHGFPEIFLRSISPYGFATKAKKKNYYKEKEFLVFYKKALDHIIRLNIEENIKIEEIFAKIILRKILTPFPTGFVDLVSPSGIINGAIVYNYNYCV